MADAAAAEDAPDARVHAIAIHPLKQNTSNTICNTLSFFEAAPRITAVPLCTVLKANGNGIEHPSRGIRSRFSIRFETSLYLMSFALGETHEEKDQAIVTTVMGLGDLLM